MMKKEKLTRLSGGRQIAQRFELLFKTLFRGNQSLMADAIDCSQAVVSQILSKKHAPGRRVLELLADHPRVNPAWLYFGEGQPLVAEKKEGLVDFAYPVLKLPLPGPAPLYGNRLTGETFAAVGMPVWMGAYWLEIQPGDSILNEENAHLLPCDLLLITPFETLQTPLPALHDQLAVVELNDGTAVWPVLRRLIIKTRGTKTRIWVHAYNISSTGKVPSDGLTASNMKQIFAENVIGLCRLTVRRFM